ncbi:hypothetical protein Tco_1497489 [Tanacetum coccineum]
MAERLQSEEQEKYTIEEKTRMLVEMIAERKKFFATLRAAEIRSRPPTKAQVRNRMCTYLKNQAGYTHKQLKGRSYDEIQKLFDKAYKQVNSFIPARGSRKKTLARKRAGEKQSEESAKRQKLEDAVEKEELKTYLKIDPDEDRAINYEALATKYPIIDWESQIIENFYKQDLVDLHKLVMKRSASRALEGYDLILWGDLKTRFEPSEEDDVWRNQQDWSLIS